MNKIKIMKEDVKSFRSSANIDEFIDDKQMDYIQDLKNKISTNYYNFCKLSLLCYDNLYINLYRILSKDKLLTFLKEIPINNNIRTDLSRYNFGNSFGDYYRENRIKDFVEQNRDRLLEVINLFFQIFSEDDE